jgi:hypothetical protein
MEALEYIMLSHEDASVDTWDDSVLKQSVLEDVAQERALLVQV